MKKIILALCLLATAADAQQYGSWPPAPSGGGTGTVTEICAGPGLNGGCITTSGTISLSIPVDVADGGTGDTSLTLDGILFGNGTGAVGVTAAGTTGQVLTATTGSAPTWQSPIGTVSSVAETVPGFLSISGSPITTSGTLAVTYSGTPLPIANGGTNGTTAVSAFSNLSPLTTNGDLLTYDGGNIRFPVGTDGQVLESQGGLLEWVTPGSGGTVTSVAFSDSGGIFSVSGSPITTNGTISESVSGVSGGLPYFSSTSQLSSSGSFTTNAVLFGGGVGGAPGNVTNNATATKEFLNQTSSGVPEYSALVSGDIPNNAANTTGTAANVTGTVTTAHGGTGQTTASAGFNALSPTTTLGDLIVYGPGATNVRIPVGTNGQVLTADSTQTDGLAWEAAASGSVTSVALSLPSIFTVTGSPVTTTGTLTGTLNTETENTVFAGPSSAGPSVPTFRALTSADIPALSYVTSVNVSGGTTGLTTSGGPITSSGTITLAGTLDVANGGTGDTSLTAYALLAGGTTSTSAVQSLATVGTSNQVLVSNGASALPTWQSYIGFLYPTTNSSYGGTNSSLSFTGTDELIIGQAAGAALTSGNDNTLLGYNAGHSLTTGTQSVFIGSGASSGTTTATNNVVIGYGSTANNNSTNVIIGASDSATAADTIVIGYSASASGLIGTAIGYQSSVSGNSAIAIGYQASAKTTNSVAIGEFSLAQTGSGASAIGPGTTAGAANATALGNGATSNTANVIQLGNTSVVGVSTSGAFNSSATQTTVSGSTSGSCIFSQPMAGLSLSKIVIYCNALVGTASYTYPTAFTNTPAILTTNGPASSVVTSLTTTAVTITGATTTGFIFLEGY